MELVWEGGGPAPPRLQECHGVSRRPAAPAVATRHETDHCSGISPRGGKVAQHMSRAPPPPNASRRFSHCLWTSTSGQRVGIYPYVPICRHLNSSNEDRLAGTAGPGDARGMHGEWRASLPIKPMHARQALIDPKQSHLCSSPAHRPSMPCPQQSTTLLFPLWVFLCLEPACADAILRQARASQH